MTRNFLLLTLAAFAIDAQAARITAGDLPADIQACLGTTCAVTMTSTIDLPSMSAYLYYDISTPTAPVENWLLRYSVGTPSNNTYVDYTAGTNAVVTPYQGSLWVKTGTAPSGADPLLDFTIFTDTLNPVPDNVYNGYASDGISPETTIHLRMTSADALAGGGFVTESGYPDFVRDGSLQRNLFTCIECGWTTTFNLIYLDYSGGFVGFDPSDTRSLLLSQSDYINAGFGFDYSNTDSFYLHSVPLPPAALLMGFGLLAVFGPAARNRWRGTATGQ